MSKISYSEKLKDPRWQKKRLEVLDRDKFTCCMCGDKDTELHVHHKSYSFGKEPYDYPLENFQTLCKNCHLIIEVYKRDFGSNVEAIEFSHSFMESLYFNVKVSSYTFHVVNVCDGSMRVSSQITSDSIDFIKKHY